VHTRSSAIFLLPALAADHYLTCVLLQPVTSGLLNNSSASKNAAALQALRRLLEAGKLDDWLQPTWVSSRRSRQLGEWGSDADRLT
jgi:hypothetical protein